MVLSEIFYRQYNSLEVYLSYQCKTENGIEDDEVFVIVELLDSLQVMVRNQYGREYKINKNQIS